MNQTESITKLSFALCKAQSEMGAAIKGSENPFFKSNYASLTDVIRAIKEPFSKHGLCYTQLPVSSEAGVGVVTRLIHESGEWIEGEFILPITKQDPQAAGAAITYARRYALQALTGVPTADSDSEAAMIRSITVEEDIEPALSAISSAETMLELQSTFKMAWHNYPKSRPALTEAKDAKKKDLTND